VNGTDQRWLKGSTTVGRKGESLEHHLPPSMGLFSINWNNNLMFLNLKSSLIYSLILITQLNNIVMDLLKALLSNDSINT
jgi:hypothetical protein